ncbi:expressed unknown protein [Seminavis robusta]|uniref:Methyltransferase domain-containing protein n=1 Tax=Seminavis robusta TaxID=568900 RepID=A0A9N8HU91_9STRA|nr:expressed unknown protein [Seminavis robusta]|eukprot:Sro2015_g311080.1 n/a (442) ;mRNA; f:11985-13310
MMTKLHSFLCLVLCFYHTQPFLIRSSQRADNFARYPRRRNRLVFYASTTKSDNPSSQEDRTSSSSSVKEKQQWITCSSTKELAHAVRNLVQPGDCVAELGSQLREVSTAICEATQGNAMLVDTTRKFPKNTERKDRTRAMRMEGDETDFFPGIARFQEIQRLEDWRHAFFFSVGDQSLVSSYDVFVVDVNSIVGNDLEWTTLSIIREFVALNDNNNPCRLVLIKSLSLNQWASRIIHGRKWCQGASYYFNNNRTTISTTAKKSEQRAPCYVVATVGVPEYRDTIPFTVQAGDAVLEIGCHLGTSTAMIHQAAAISRDDTDTGTHKGYCIGVDIGNKIVQGAQRRHANIYFAVGDAWRTAELLRIQKDFLQQETDDDVNQRIGFDVVYVDVGGLSGPDGLMEALSLISALENALEPRCIVIKSLCVRRLSSTLVPYWKLQSS